MGGPPTSHNDQLGRYEGERDRDRDRERDRSGAMRRTAQSPASSWADEMEEYEREQNRRDTVVPHQWYYQQDQAAVLHLDGCAPCQAYARHKFESSMTRDLSLEEAMARQRRHLGGETKLALARANTVIARKNEDITLMERDAEDMRRRIRRLEDQLEEEAANGPSRKRARRRDGEPGPSNEGPPPAVDRPTGPPPAPATATPAAAATQPTSTPYADVIMNPPGQPDPMEQDFPSLEPASEPLHGRGVVPFHSLLTSGKHKLPDTHHYSEHDFTVRNGRLAIQARINEPQGIVPPRGRMHINDRGFPMNEEEWDSLVARANTSKNFGAYNLAKAFVAMAQATPAAERPAYYKSAMIRWRTPEWMRLYLARSEPSTSSSAQAETQAPPGQHYAGFRDDGYPKINQPTASSSPEEWAAWLWVYQRNSVPPPGILINPNGRIPLRNIRGMLLIRRFQPEPIPNSPAERNRTVYTQMAATLFAVPHQYQDILEHANLHISDEPVRYAPYDGPIENISPYDLAKFYAEHGVSIALADDAYVYALAWVKASISTRPQQAEDLALVLEGAKEALENDEEGEPPYLKGVSDLWHSSSLRRVAPKPFASRTTGSSNAQAGPSAQSSSAQPTKPNTSGLPAKPSSSTSTKSVSSKDKGKAPMRPSIPTALRLSSTPRSASTPSIGISPNPNRFATLAEPTIVDDLPVSGSSVIGSTVRAAEGLPVSGSSEAPVALAPPPYEAVPTTIPSTGGSTNDGERPIQNNSSTDPSGSSGQDIEMREQ